METPMPVVLVPGVGVGVAVGELFGMFVGVSVGVLVGVPLQAGIRMEFWTPPPTCEEVFRTVALALSKL